MGPARLQLLAALLALISLASVTGAPISSATGQRLQGEHTTPACPVQHQQGGPPLAPTPNQGTSIPPDSRKLVVQLLHTFPALLTVFLLCACPGPPPTPPPPPHPPPPSPHLPVVVAGPDPELKKFTRAGCDNFTGDIWQPLRPAYHITLPYGWMNGEGRLQLCCCDSSVSIQMACLMTSLCIVGRHVGTSGNELHLQKKKSCICTHVTAHSLCAPLRVQFRAAYRLHLTTIGM